MKIFYCKLYVITSQKDKYEQIMFSRVAIFALIAALMVAVGSSFSLGRNALVRSNTGSLSMVMAPPGMKPDGSGGFKVAGEHPKTFLLEMDNGDKAIIETENLSCSSWICNGKEMMKAGKESIQQCFPAAGTPIKGHFVPEERAKKLSFDRMIYKLEPDDVKDVEYRVDITLREGTLEYDVIVKNFRDSPVDCSNGILFNTDAKVVEYKGYTEGSDTEVKTGAWSAPVGKFKENTFYVKLQA